MKLIIAGSRTLFPSLNLIDGAITMFNLGGYEIVSGMANGVDTCGLEYAKSVGLSTHRFPAAWATHGRKAGPIRNAEMADYSDALLLIWDGSSRGSANMLTEMKKRGKPVYEVIIKGV